MTKLGDRVRIIGDVPDRFRGMLGYINGFHEDGYIVQLKDTPISNANSMVLTSSNFINLEPREIKGVDYPKELMDFFTTKPKQVSFNFTLPVETQESDLHFEIDGKEYSVKLRRIN